MTPSKWKQVWLILTSSADVLDASFEHAQKADLCLAMGSSLTVTPAADIPEVRFHSSLFCFSIEYQNWKCAKMMLSIVYFFTIMCFVTRCLAACWQSFYWFLHFFLHITPMFADSGRERPASRHCQPPADTPGPPGQVAHPCQVWWHQQTPHDQTRVADTTIHTEKVGGSWEASWEVCSLNARPG